jgi:hypothetical protein
MAEILRPMSTGELLDRTLALYKRNFKLFVGIASLGPATYLVFELLTISSASVRAGSPNRVNPFSAASLGFSFVAGFVIMMAGMAIAHAATVRAVAAVHLGFPIRIWEAFRSLKGRLWRVIGVFVCIALLVLLMVVAGAFFLGVVIVGTRGIFSGNTIPRTTALGLLVVLVPALMIGIVATIVWVRYALAIACCIVEDLGVVKSLKRSSALSKGSRLRILLVYIVFFTLNLILGFALRGLVQRVGSLIPSATTRLILTFLAGFITGTLTGPLATIGIALIYYDERVRKEAFDLQLMMSSLDPPAPLPDAAVVVQP